MVVQANLAFVPSPAEHCSLSRRSIRLNHIPVYIAEEEVRVPKLLVTWCTMMLAAGGPCPSLAGHGSEAVGAIPDADTDGAAGGTRPDFAGRAAAAPSVPALAAPAVLGRH